MQARSERAAIVLVACAMLAACFGGGGITPIETSFNKGVYQLSKDNYAEAEREFRDALAENPEDYRARFNLALTLELRAGQAERQGQADEARAMRDRAEEQYRLILEKRPDDLRAGVNLAAMEYERGQRDEATGRLRRLAEIHPQSPLPRTALAAHLVREAPVADVAGRQSRLEEARELLTEALRHDEVSLEANMLLGNVLADLGMPDDARAAYDRALARDPSDVATLAARGRLEYDAGNPEQASVWYYRVLNVLPDHYEAHYFLWKIHRSENALVAALRHLQDAERLDFRRPDWITRPDYPGELQALYRILGGLEPAPPR
jgi:tetratricopeptide (TPR) repeat protein